MGGWTERWKAIHLALAPFGVLLSTWLLSLAAGAWRWHHREDLEFGGTITPLGAAVYGVAVLTMEGGFRMFWALAQIEKDRKAFREEGRKEGRTEGRREGRTEGRVEGRTEGRQELARQIRDAAVESGRLLPEEVDQILSQVFNGESGNHQSAAPDGRHRHTRRRRRRR